MTRTHGTLIDFTCLSNVVEVIFMCLTPVESMFGTVHKLVVSDNNPDVELAAAVFDSSVKA